jgi:DDE domain
MILGLVVVGRGLFVDVSPPQCRGFRYPAGVIAHCVWLYHRFPLSYREVEELMLARSVVVSYETIRQWCAKFGPEYARELRRRKPQVGDKWHLDEAYTKINGEWHYLWRAVDQDGNVLDNPGPVTPRCEGGKAVHGQADEEAVPGAAGAGDRQAPLLRCRLSGVDGLGQAPTVEVPETTARRTPTNQPGNANAS